MSDKVENIFNGDLRVGTLAMKINEFVLENAQGLASASVIGAIEMAKLLIFVEHLNGHIATKGDL